VVCLLSAGQLPGTQ